MKARRDVSKQAVATQRLVNKDYESDSLQSDARLYNED
jgi:hypothetical protein